MMIKLYELIGKNCSSRETIVIAEEKKTVLGGEDIRKKIEDNWDSSDMISISFENVLTSTPSFIDESIGKLLLKHDITEIQKKVRFVKLSDLTKSRINKAVSNRIKNR